ncbi:MULTISPECIES: amino acid permease [Paenibacillus]|uniref:amino acid permease n=1 Tax=Paenibacillus TaxID=44249 RepID=UPI00043487C2|nr:MULTISPECIES: amino acid permease [Paenibacillus]CDN44125.1 Uncharacterized transporter YcgH [Paenibacillus sp. P22]
MSEHLKRPRAAAAGGAGSEGGANGLSWWKLSLFGAGCTIGTAFFLGTGIAVRRSGFLVLPIFLAAAAATYFVYEALASMTAEQPEKGSFRAYAKKAYGRWAGFSTGWIYWSSELLILGGSLTALGLFTRYWLPAVPLWVFAAGYAVLALAVVVLGSKGINTAENLFAVVKIAAVAMFIAVAAFMLLSGRTSPAAKPAEWRGLLEAGGWKGAWSGLLYAFYAFSGIEVMGFMAAGLKRPADAPKAGRIMLLGIGILYLLSIGLAIVVVPRSDMNSSESPFVQTLEVMRLSVLVHMLNGVLIVAGFSILVASLYGVSTMLVSLASDGDAPRWLTRTAGARRLPWAALLVNAGGMTVSVVLALLLPSTLFEHLATAGGLVLLYVWMFIVATYLKLHKPGLPGWIKSGTALALMAAAASGSLLEPAGRPGFWASLAIAAAVGAVTLAMSRRWKGGQPQPGEEKRSEGDACGETASS